MLTKNARCIDSLNTLLKKDIWLHTKRVGNTKVEVISLRLKSTKESRAQTRGVVIEIYGNKSPFCAVTGENYITFFSWESFILWRKYGLIN